MRKLLFLLALVSCSAKEDISPKLTTDSELQSFVDQFYDDAGITAEVVAVFKAQADGRYSASHKDGNVVVIEVNRQLIDGVWPGKYKSSVYREMAHMLLEKEYITDNGTTSRHFDIMNVQFCPCEDDGSNWDTALTRLFSK